MKNSVIIPLLFILLLLIQCTNHSKLPAGYPDRSSTLDVLPGFKKPPGGYGEVPFYWWQGDTLTKERLLWQLNKLADKGISSLQINYSHLDYGGLSYGLSNPSKPALFSDEWWNLFKWFSSEARKRGMTVSLSDYTIGIGQGFSMDEALKNDPDLNGSVLRHQFYIVKGKANIKVADNLLMVNSYKFRNDSTLIAESRKDLLPFVKNGKLTCNVGNTAVKIIAVNFEKLIPSYDPMNPRSGETYNKYFFDKFEKALPEKGSDALNFFFSDELNFRVSGNLWNRYFADEFKKRKGYDVTTRLDALFTNTGPETSRIRIDYNDVLVALSEENFFKPVYQWHQDRGMIFGCDHGGRGKDVAEFGDYFRTQRWNQGPGSDQPVLSKDIIKAKVAASISHLYERQRVWLEGFHSSGWGTSSAALTDAIFANYVAGYNLMSFHGLYYSTIGGWWEWAPPDNHFRNPYWQQIDPLMNCIQRLSYLLSQGFHRCDVAIIYPTEPVIAGIDGDQAVKTAFETGEQIYNKGIDFDFIDYESLAKCEIRDKELNVSGEKYKVLIIPSMKVIRYSSLKKIEEFKKAGGLVVCVGSKPELTELYGADDPETIRLRSSIFASGSNIICCNKAENVTDSISGKYDPNFSIISGTEKRTYVMHRIIGNRDVYALYNFPEGSRCFFKAKGNVQLWDPWNGKIASLTDYSEVTDNGTNIELPLSEKEIQIIVFDKEKSRTDIKLEKRSLISKTELDEKWEFELSPYLDNKWGDYQLPAKNELLGAQIRQLYLCEDSGYAGGKIEIDESWRRVTCSYGPQFLKIGALKNKPSAEEMLKICSNNAGKEVIISGNNFQWEEYSFSWQYGVEGDYGHQGWHGLKGKMYDNFIRMGAVKEVKMSKFRVSEPEGNYYLLYSSVIAPADNEYELLTGDIKPSAIIISNKIIDPNNNRIKLKEGPNPIVLLYDKACETYLVLRDPSIPRPEKQGVSMSWYGDSGLLPFDCSINEDYKGLFTFESAPALRSLAFKAHGNIKVWIDGYPELAVAGNRSQDGLTEYSVNVKESKPESSRVVLSIEYQPGYRSAGAIPEYIEQVTGSGSILLGDWSENDGLRAYSGGAWYRKNINIEKKSSNGKIEIDLGNLVSSAELLINGNSAGIKLSPPWTYDITNYVKSGENRIEVLVYNTLANNYTSIPTRYRGDIKSGLIGPVNLVYYSENNSQKTLNHQ